MSEVILKVLPSLLKDQWQNPAVQKMVHTAVRTESVQQQEVTLGLHEQISLLRARRHRDLGEYAAEVDKAKPEIRLAFETINGSKMDETKKRRRKQEIAYSFAKDDPIVCAIYKHYQELEDYVRRGVYEVFGEAL